MDLWGFEGRYRHELPGDRFGLFMPPTPVTFTIGGRELPVQQVPGITEGGGSGTGDQAAIQDFVQQQIRDHAEQAAQAGLRPGMEYTATWQENGQPVTYTGRVPELTGGDGQPAAPATPGTPASPGAQTTSAPPSEEQPAERELTPDQRRAQRAAIAGDAIDATANLADRTAGLVSAASEARNAGVGTSSYGYSSGGGGLDISGFGGSSSIAGFGGVGDLTGTGFSIQSSGGDYRQKARQTDAILRQLMAAIAAGNVDAISSAITILTMRSKSTMIQASLQVIGAMRQYDNQMRQLSDQMGALNSRNPNYQSQLAGLNGQLQSVSMGRQAIANTLRDVMGMNEEISTFEKSIYDVKSRTQSSYARWT